MVGIAGLIHATTKVRASMHPARLRSRFASLEGWVSAMRTWLRLTLVTVTVGGGFTGVALMLQSLLTAGGHPPQPMANYVLMSVFFALFAFVTVSGLVFVHDARRIKPLIVALGIQVPWVSSPLLVYKFTAGFETCVAVGIIGNFYGGFQLGSNYQFSYFQWQSPWGVGVNLFALAILVLLAWSPKWIKNQVPTERSQETG
jgi:hypothetical protein